MKQNKKTTLLVVMDGWGKADPKNVGNAITLKTAPNYFKWLKKFPNTELEASGKAVGLFSGQEGNSEAGHLNLGAGRIVKQDALYISDAIKDGTFFKNQAFLQAIHHVKKYKTSVHVMGLLSNHNSAHSSPEHLYGLLDLFNKVKIKKVFIHLFADGRDSGQHDAASHLSKLKKHLYGNEKIVTLMGRFYGMDRGKNWERTKKAYEAMVLGEGLHVETVEQALSEGYNRGETDEFIEPTVIKNGNHHDSLITDNDAIFFFNMRSDRARQLTKVFVQPDFEKINPGSFKRKKFPKNTRFVAMSDFGPDLPGVFTAYPSRDVKDSLVQMLCPKKQLYIAESEKFAHVTYFFNGGYAQHFCAEDWVKIDSIKIDSYDKSPEMRAKEVGAKVIKAINSHQYEFIMVNFANPDMVGHTGNLLSAKKAVRIVDIQVQKVIDSIIKNKGQAIITADHGNVESMIDLKTSEVNTQHTVNPVPCIFVGFNTTKKRLRKGTLADVAPTILKMMDLDKPKQMTGKSLI